MEMEITIEEARQKYPLIKESTLAGLYRYVEKGIPTGGFLQAVLENDLVEAFGRADEENRATLFQIVSFVYMYVPSPAWHSAEAVKKWLGGGENVMHS